jgi:cytoskeletal protein CcmA (bactofilin family)
MLDSERMHIFGKKEEPRQSEGRPGRNTVLETPGRLPRTAPVNHSVPLPMKPSIVSEGSAPSPLKASLISEGFEFTGDMKSDGSLTVDGAIKGNLIVQTLLIRATGVVDGGVKADSVNVEGCLSGTVECRDLVIGGRAVVDGKLRYDTVTIQRGGTIKGDLKRG